MALDHLRVAVAFCAFIVALLAILTVVKKRQRGTLQFNDRGIFWTVAICMFEITMLCIALGILSPSLHNSTQLFTCILGFVISGVLAYFAERIHKSTQAKISEENHDEESEAEPSTESPADLANKIFAKAIKEGYIEEVDGHYKRKNMSKALLTYMCGRIYCGDKSERVGESNKYIWKQGEGVFPESDLNKLFDESGLAQARYNRAGTAVPQGFESIDIFF